MYTLKFHYNKYIIRPYVSIYDANGRCVKTLYRRWGEDMAMLCKRAIDWCFE